MDQNDILSKFELLPKQKTFLTHILYNEQCRHIRYVGGFGSGKSFIGCLTCIILSFQYPYNRGVIGRSTLVDLKNTTMKTFFEMLEFLGMYEDKHYYFDKKENRLFFLNGKNGGYGSEIIFTGLDDISKVKGLELGFLYVDEVDEVGSMVYKVLSRRLRNKNAPRRVGFITSNSEGKNRTYQTFVRGKGIKEEFLHRYYTIRASSLENKNLPPDYIDDLLSYEGDEFKRYVLGEFNVFEGQIYDELDETIHVIPPFDIPEGWERLYGHDHGLANPTAMIEGHIDQDGNLYVTREHYEAGKTIEYHSNKFKERVNILDEQGKSITTNNYTLISDPAIFAKTRQPTPEKPFPFSVADEYADYGIGCIKGNNSVLAGIDKIKYLLKNKKIFIFDTCVKLIQEFNSYRWKTNKDKSMGAVEAPVKENDHALDALRYMVMSKYSAPQNEIRSSFKDDGDILQYDILCIDKGIQNSISSSDDEFY